MIGRWAWVVSSIDAALRGLPCLLLTGSEDRGAEIRALDAGADAFVRKDENITVVLARLSAMLRSAGAPADFAKFIESEVKVWGDIVRTANVTLPD